MNKIVSLLILSTLILLSLACGGGGGGESSSSESSTASLRLAGKEGDTLSAYSLSGNLIGETTFDSSGSASLTLSTNASYILKVGIGGNTLLETIVRSSDFSNVSSGSLSVAINGATTWATQKIMTTSDDDLSESSITSLLSSQTGLSSLYDLTLDSVASKLSDDDLEEVKLYTLVNGMVIKSIDEGSFDYSWSSISHSMLNNFDLESSTSDETILDNAKSLATLLRTQIKLDTPLTTSDFNDGLQGLLGTDTDAMRMISGVQAGDTSATLSVIYGSGGSTSSTELYDLGVAALEAEDMLEAYQYFAAAVTSNPDDGKARFLLAMTRIMSLSLKGTKSDKEFLDILDLEFDFIDNNHLQNDDGDDIDAIDADLYETPDQVAEIFDYDELEEYLTEVVLHELSLSIADLDLISSSDFSTDLVITPAMQGYIEEDDNGDEILPSSNILVDIIDVTATKSALEFAKAKINMWLMNNLEVSGENDSGSSMKDLLIQGVFANQLYLEGESTFSLSNNYSGNADVGANNLSTFTFAAGYPDEIVLSEDTPEGEKNILDVEEMDSDEIMYFSSWYPNLTSITDPIYKVDGELVLAINDISTEFQMTGAFQGNSFDFFQADVYEYRDSDGDGVLDFIATYVLSGSLSSGNLDFHSTYEHIDGNDVHDYIEEDSNFLTIKDSFASDAQSSLSNALTAAVSMLEQLQGLGDNADRIDHIVDNKESLERDDGSTFEEAEINNFQTFLDDVNDALDGPAIVDPSFLSNSNYTSQSLDLSVFFSTNARTFFTDDQGNIVESTYDDPDTNDLLEASVRDEDNLFSQTYTGSDNNTIADVYAEFFEEADNWLTVEQPTTITDTVDDSNDTNDDAGNDSSSDLSKTILTGTATFSDVFYPIQSMTGGGNEDSVLTIEGSTTPGEVVVIDNETGQTFTGFVNGLNIYVQDVDTLSDPDEAFTIIIAFTDSSFTEAVYLYSFKEEASGTGLATAELGKMTLNSGSLSATHLGSSVLSGSASITHQYNSLSGGSTQSETFSMSASGNSFLSYSAGDGSGSYLLSTYGLAFVGAAVESDGFGIICGLFDGSSLDKFSAYEMTYSEGDSYAMADMVLGTVTSGLVSLSHSGTVAYSGSSLTTSVFFTDLNNSTESTDGNLTATVGSELITTTGNDTGMLMGPIMFVGKHDSAEYSLGILFFSDNNYSDFYGVAGGYDGSAWMEVNRGTKSSGDLVYE